MQVNGLNFTLTDGSWTLTDDAGYALNQSSVKKMVKHDLTDADGMDHHDARRRQRLRAG